MRNSIELFSNERQQLYSRFSDKLETANHLSRKVVSFQANKEEPIYRWFKYKEGFSSSLVKYFLSEYSKKPGKVLDPFAGVGTTLFASQELGWQSYGIEILPVGIFVMQAREALNNITVTELKKITNNLWSKFKKIDFWESRINHIPITKCAFSDETETLLNKYLAYCSKIKNTQIRTVLQFTALSVTIIKR
jgi:adenine specific DNA methylase Mod